MKIIHEYIKPIIGQRLWKYESLKNAIHTCSLYGIDRKNQRCQVCGQYTLGDGWGCHKCGWIQDLVLCEDGYSEVNSEYIQDVINQYGNNEIDCWK